MPYVHILRFPDNNKRTTYKGDPGCPPVDSAVRTFQGSTDVGDVEAIIVLTASGRGTITA